MPTPRRGYHAKRAPALLLALKHSSLDSWHFFHNHNLHHRSLVLIHISPTCSLLLFNNHEFCYSCTRAPDALQAPWKTNHHTSNDYGIDEYRNEERRNFRQPGFDLRQHAQLIHLNENTGFCFRPSTLATIVLQGAPGEAAFTRIQRRLQRDNEIDLDESETQYFFPQHLLVDQRPSWKCSTTPPNR